MTYTPLFPENARMNKRFAVATVTLTLILGIYSVMAQSNTGKIDFDQEPRLIYKQEFLAKLPIGHLPGEIGIKPFGTRFISPTILTLDPRLNIYVDDKINHRVQMFNQAGKFEKVVFLYPQRYSVGSMAVDATGHIFLAMLDTNEVWEILHSKVVKKYELPSKISISGPFVSLLPDGRAWMHSGTIPTTYSLLGGKKEFVYDENTPSMEWPWTHEGRIVVSKRPGGLEIMLVPAASKSGHQIIFHTTQDGIRIVPRIAVQDQILFSVRVGEKTLVSDVRLSDMNTASILVPDGFGFSLDSGLAATGIYSLHSEELEEAGSGKYSFEILKAVPVDR